MLCNRVLPQQRLQVAFGVHLWQVCPPLETLEQRLGHNPECGGWKVLAGRCLRLALRGWKVPEACAAACAARTAHRPLAPPARRRLSATS